MINSILTPEFETNFELSKDDFKKFLMELTKELAEEYNKRAKQKAKEEQKELERAALDKVTDVLENYFRLFSSNEEIIKVASKSSQVALMKISEMLRKAGDGKKCDEAGVGDGHHTPSISNTPSILPKTSSTLPKKLSISVDETSFSPKANKTVDPTADVKLTKIDNTIKKSNFRPYYTSLEALLDDLNLN